MHRAGITRTVGEERGHLAGVVGADFLKIGKDSLGGGVIAIDKVAGIAVVKVGVIMFIQGGEKLSFALRAVFSGNVRQDEHPAADLTAAKQECKAQNERKDGSAAVCASCHGRTLPSAQSACLSQGKKLVRHLNSIFAICNSTLLLLH